MVKKEKKEKPPAPSCAICCEAYNKTARKQLDCPFCNNSCCMQCAKTYLGGTIADPHCMHCKVAWNNSFMREKFPSSWLSKEYRAIREKLLFDIECAKIPMTQKFCDAASSREKVRKERDSLLENIKESRKRLDGLKSEYDDCNQYIWIMKCEESVELEGLKARSHELYTKMKEINETIELCEDRCADCSAQITNLSNIIEGSEKVSADEHFKLKCPKDNCKGFVSRHWKCGLCSTRVCSECREAKSFTNIHTCNEDVKASVKILQDDSKPCPKCASLIYKIEGCNQMWCTQCRNAFDWKTGESLDRNFHNPHYVEWLKNRKEGKVTEVRRAEDCVQSNFVAESRILKIVDLVRKKLTDEKEKETILSLARLLIHIRDVEVNAVPDNVRKVPHDPNRELRIEYMLNRVSEEEFRSILQKREKDRQKRQENALVFTTFVDVADDLLNVFLTTEELSKERFFKELEDIRVYTNKNLKTVAEHYSTKHREIPVDFERMITLQRGNSPVSPLLLAA
ncbi:MAG: hypothetical protein JWR85_3651 [Marmoricola sp.]|nr:hypothetical protein [Marmoricola sp.]